MASRHTSRPRGRAADRPPGALTRTDGTATIAGVEAPIDTDEATPDETPLTRPSVLGALRGAGVDFYFHSIRLIPANFVWGLVLLGVLMVIVAAGPGFGVLVAPVLGIPLVGVHRMAGLATRGRDVTLRDLWRGMRQRWLQGLVAGIAQTWITVLLTIDIVTGFGGTHPLQWALGTVGFWALVGAGCLAVALWPVLGDPDRPRLRFLDAVRLAALVALTAPGRTLLFAIAIGLLLVLSTVAFAFVLTVSVAFAALLAARVVLPEADRIDRLRDRGLP
jgi:hypothetical protein